MCSTLCFVVVLQWCGPCTMTKPAARKAAAELHGIAKVGYINCDGEHQEFCAEQGVTYYPFLMVRQRVRASACPWVCTYICSVAARTNHQCAAPARLVWRPDPGTRGAAARRGLSLLHPSVLV